MINKRESSFFVHACVLVFPSSTSVLTDDTSHHTSPHPLILASPNAATDLPWNMEKSYYK